MSIIVAKFGGTSMATGHSFRVAASRVARNDDIRIAVVSAPGKINGRNDPQGKSGQDGVKVTDRLLRIAEKARKNEPLEEDISALERRFSSIEDSIALPDSGRVSGKIGEIVRQRARITGEDDAPLAALGEELNARLFAAYLNMLHIRAEYLDPMDAGFRVSMHEGRICVDDSQYPEISSKVQKALDQGVRVVFPGFFGYDESGAIRTFPRGGSDYTGSVLAAAMRAGMYQNFTDTDGIRAVEPSIDPGALVIRQMTHRELTELTLGGAFGVFQYEAAVPLAIHGVVTQVLDTFDHGSMGTHILPQVGGSRNEITGIVHRGEFVAFEIIKYGIANAVGFFKQVTGLFESMGISFEHAPSSVNDISVIVRKKNLGQMGPADVASAIRERIRPHQLKIHDLSAVAIVGEEVSRSPGLGWKVFRAVSEAGVNVPYHNNQGISFVLWLRNGDAEKAARAIYRDRFGESDGRTSLPATSA